MDRPKNQFRPLTPKFCTSIHVGEGCGDLPTTKFTYQDGTPGIGSTWVMASLWERIKFLFSGKISLVIVGHQQPPVAIYMDELGIERSMLQ